MTKICDKCGCKSGNHKKYMVACEQFYTCDCGNCEGIGEPYWECKNSKNKKLSLN